MGFPACAMALQLLLGIAISIREDVRDDNRHAKLTEEESNVPLVACDRTVHACCAVGVIHALVASSLARFICRVAGYGVSRLGVVDDGST